MAQETLAQKVRAKYPGAYDDLSDQDLEAAVRKKYPGVYDDIPLTPMTAQRAATPAASTDDDGLLEGLAKGVVKSGLSVIEEGGKLIRSIPGVGPLLSRGPEVTLPISTSPSNTTQAIGKMAGDVAQFAMPGMGGTRLVRGAKAAGLSMLQGAGPVASGVSGALTAVLPGGSVAAKASDAMRQGAEQSMVRALGPTKEWAKEQAKTLAPQMIERGVKGSRPAMLAQAASKTTALGREIGSAIDKAGTQGTTVNGNLVLNAISRAKYALMSPDGSGAERVIPGAESVVKRLDKLYSFVVSLGEDIPIEQAHQLRKTWDQIVSKAGLYGQKVGASSTDSATAWATREAASAFRGLIAKADPDIAALNKEYAFWKGLKDVLTETERRTQAQSGGLGQLILGGSGATIGAMTGTSTSDRVQNAFLGGVAGRQVIKLMQSPAWRTRVSAPYKNMLADALASGSAQRVESVVRTIIRAMPAQFRPAEESE